MLGSNQCSTPVLGQRVLVEESYNPSTNVPETPVANVLESSIATMDSFPTSHINDGGDQLNEAVLVEAQITWDIGKLMGFKVSNDEQFIAELSKLDKDSGEETKRRRGRPKKKRGGVEA